MIEAFLLAFLVAKLKKYKLKPFFTTWTTYLVLIFTAAYIVFEILIFFDNYSILPFVKTFIFIYMSLFFILAFWYGRYAANIVGAAFVILGSSLNKIVIMANGGKMPVFPSLSVLTGYTDANMIYDDNLHILGNSETKYKFLSDIFDVGYSIMSIGDIFIRMSAFVILLSVIKHLNERSKLVSEKDIIEAVK